MVNSTNPLQKAMYNQAEEYATYLESKMGDKIAKIILFGSLSKNESQINSDIDILIIHFGSDDLEEQLAAETLNYMIKSGAPIEYIPYGYFEVKYNPSYFVHSILEKGVVLYMKDEEKLKKKEIEGYIDLSEIFMNDAQECFKRNRIRATIDLAYNALELKIKALLLNLLEDLPGSHGGLISKFGELYIMTKKIPKELGKNLNIALSLRNKARYDPLAILTKENGDFILSLIKELSKFL